MPHRLRRTLALGLALVVAAVSLVTPARAQLASPSPASGTPSVSAPALPSVPNGPARGAADLWSQTIATALVQIVALLAQRKQTHAWRRAIGRRIEQIERDVTALAQLVREDSMDRNERAAALHLSPSTQGAA